MIGTVYKSTGSWYAVKGDDGNFYQCRIRGKFRLAGRKVTNPVAVGDRVEFDTLTEEEGFAVIVGLGDRENYIIRASPKKTAHAHILASNLDQALLICTLTFPRTSLGFIDRFLVTAEAFGVPAVLVFNKLDLMEEEHRAVLEELRQLYEPLGYPCVFTSAVSEEGVGGLRLLLHGKTTLVSGHSGTGKSTLLNLLAPHIEQKTGEVSTFANKGTHTTTFAEMFDLDEATRIIDTPGIKELGLIDLAPEEIGKYMPEFRERLEDCKFHNCTHLHEPGCAVVEAVIKGEIAPSRYDSYGSMLEADDNRR